MTQARVINGLLVLGLVVLVIWFARNTYWAEVSISMPPKGEALSNPFYVQQQFAQALGAKTERRRGIKLPSSNDVIVMAAWNWELTPDRRKAFEQWVEAGGRLVVDESLIDSGNTFAQWSGIERELRRQPSSRAEAPTNLPRCYTLDEATGPAPERYTICGIDSGSFLKSLRTPDWGLRRDNAGTQVIRVKVGRGSVTLINGRPFVEHGLFEDDNARLFVAATQLHSGDVIHFFTEDNYPSLLTLAWQLGWPVICLLTALLILTLWRNGVRFGPLAAPTDMARRSLAEQIRGTGRFALRIGSAEALSEATARALHEAARAHITAYDHLPGTQRMNALAQATGIDADVLAAALYNSEPQRPEQLRQHLRLLESARRRLLLKNIRQTNGNRL